LNQGQYFFTFSGEFCEPLIKGLSYLPGHTPPRYCRKLWIADMRRAAYPSL
jgi:hypothetical protein